MSEMSALLLTMLWAGAAAGQRVAPQATEAVPPDLTSLLAEVGPEPVGATDARLALHRTCLEWTDTLDRRMALGYALLAAAGDRAALLPGRRFALALLGEYADERVTPELSTLLHDPDVALDTVRALRHIPHTDPTAALAVALGWAKGDLLVAILDALAARGDPRSVSDVVGVLRASRALDARRAALRALGLIGDPSALEVVLHAARELETRQAGVLAGLRIAQRLPDDTADETYRTLLGLSPTDGLRAASLVGLGRVGGHKAKVTAECYVEHPSLTVRLAAERALRDIAAREGDGPR